MDLRKFTPVALTLLALASVASIAVGLAMIYAPLAFIFVGVYALAAVALGD